MPLQGISGWVTPEQDFKGLYKVSDDLEKNNLRQQKAAEQKQAKVGANSKFLADYLDPKAWLTGTNYDPMIIHGFDEVLKQGTQLAMDGADTSQIMMAIAPNVDRLHQYSTKAKLVDQNIKAGVQKLKAYKGYNGDALSDEAKKAAFYNADGTMKDPNDIDINTDWLSEAVKNNPEKVTTNEGIRDFVAKTPMQEVSNEVQTMYAGRKRNVKYDAKMHPWMQVKKDSNGNAITDAAGNPVGLEIISDNILDDNNKPIVNPETKEPYKALNKQYFHGLISNNPDATDYLRGQVKLHFKELGADKMPTEGSPQYDLMARHIAYDELKQLDNSTFKTIDKKTESPINIKMELGLPTDGKKGADAAIINDVVGRVNNKMVEAEKNGLTGIRFNALDANDQATLLKYVKDLKGNDITNEDIFIGKDGDEISIFKKSDGGKLVNDKSHLIGSLNQLANIGGQVNTKGKAAVVAKGNVAPTKNYKVNGKSYSHKALIDMGYSEQDIQDAIKLGTIKP